ncbi:MAG: PSD1 and planctomycete cytochrome C domain-containing protein [Verrucomicrobiota bacterium]
MVRIPKTSQLLAPSAFAGVLLFLSTPLNATSLPSPDFAREVQPILNNHCAECHGGVKKKGGLSITNRTDTFAKLKSGTRAVVPGNLEQSELFHRITTDDEGDRMPPEHPLEPEEIEILKKWIAAGAPWPEHWATRPLNQPTPPDTRNQSWPRNPIDKFVLAKLEHEKIIPSSPAPQHTLVRRLFLDLTGLIPSPQELAKFKVGTPEFAVEPVVDFLLASPHFGERWGRHWLDEARYADSAGYEKDSPRNDAFHFRDWVINAINNDLPFDQFTIKQIAGDLLPEATTHDLVATKFHLQTQFNLEGGVDAEEDRTKRVIDRISTVGSVWLGSTVGCTQCHDHPYDPITHREFFELYAFFNNAEFRPVFAGGTPPPDAALRFIERNKSWEPLAKMIEEQVTNKNLSNKIQASLTRLRKLDNEKGFTRVLSERHHNRRPTHIFRRGDFLQPLVEEGNLNPGTPAVWPALSRRSPHQTADRLDLAHWLVQPDHPLTARVTVNKIWLHLFGNPLATQPQDFGTRGDAPLHPELLDWLAWHFIHDAKWSRKQFIKTIVSSATYQQASLNRTDLAEIDPGNTLLARQNRFRVQGEIVRDLYLQAAGLLSRKIGGPSVFPPIPEDVAAQSYNNNFQWKTSTGEDRYRRGLYTFFKRTAPDPNLTTFDCPDASMSKPLRDDSNTPLQALATLQNEVFHEAAQAFAKRLLSNNDLNDDNRIREAFSITLGRTPLLAEKKLLVRSLNHTRQFYERHPERAAALVGPHSHPDAPVSESAAWVATTRIILNLDEFITRE